MQQRHIKIYKFQSLGNNMPLGEKKVQNQTHITKENKDKHMQWTTEAQTKQLISKSHTLRS
jgi:hypothetical protein